MGGGGLNAATAAASRSACVGDYTGGGELSAATAAARRSASMGDCDGRAATAAARRSASMGDCDVSAATVAILCVKSRAVHGKISHSPERRACCDICRRCTATTRAQ